MINLPGQNWLARQTLANKVTLLRIILIPLCISTLLSGLFGLTAGLFLLLSFSDAIDGYIARKYGEISELGKKLDPLADKLLVITMLIGLTALGLASPLPVMLIAARELVIASFRGERNFGADQLAKWKTVVQIVAVFMLLLALPLAGMVLWLAALLSLLSGGLYLWRPLLDQKR